jgi:ubiquinone/menaquinone biosynthesis C-methylase UbiE
VVAADSLKLIVSILHSLEIRSLLDVGTATGRCLLDFVAAFSGALVCGAEPVRALLDQAALSGVTASIPLLQASGQSLPFADGSLDAVIEISVLHHVPDPSLVVSEMLRIARRVVVIADSNRFRQGSLPARLFKLILYKAGLWRAFDFAHTRGSAIRSPRATDCSTPTAFMIRIIWWRSGRTASCYYRAARAALRPGFIRS